MSEKILYVSDLDATLLNNKAGLSDFTRKTLEALIDKGLLFTFASARSYVSASGVLGGFEVRIPSIIYNGTFIRKSDTGERVLLDSFEKSDSLEILSVLEGDGVHALVYAFIDGKELFSYVPEKLNDGTREFVREHSSDPRNNPVNESELSNGEIFHFTCIDEPEKLIPLYNKLSGKYQCVYYKEQYSDRWWLEIHPKGATKANALLKLKEMLGAHRVVCFGDGVNDISMFEVADECYAVANAEDAVKKIATGVIESNENDGVARWLLKNGKY